MDEAPPRVITVTGTGAASAPADTATVTLGVSLVAASVAQATSNAATLADQIIASLLTSGIESSNIQTADYSVFPEHDHRSGQPVLRGYRVNNTLRVTTGDLDQISDVLEQATQAGGDATTVQGISFGLSDERPVRTEARDAAWHDATASAGQLAALAGLTLGSPISITEGSAGAPSPRRVVRTARLAESSAPPIEGGETAVSISLTVEFEAG